MIKPLTALLLCAALLAGCNESGSDAGDEKNALVQQGLQKVQLKQWNEAVRLFREVLDTHPNLARADLELALIYHQQQQNYVRAAYHYERYLEKRPDSEKRELIDRWIRQTKISIAAEVGQNSDEVDQDLVRLKRENEMLRNQLARGGAPKTAHVKTLLTKPPPKRTVTDPAPQPTPAVAANPTPAEPKPIARIQTPAPTVQTYTVRPGDTLSKIARTVYGDTSKYKEIFLANQDTMDSENDIKVGQVINIPTVK